MIYNRKKRENFVPFCLSVFLLFSFLFLFLSWNQISWSFIHCYLSAVNFLLRISFHSWSSFSFLSIFFIFSFYVLNFYLSTFLSFLFSFYVSISLHFFLSYFRFMFLSLYISFFSSLVLSPTRTCHTFKLDFSRRRSIDVIHPSLIFHSLLWIKKLFAGKRKKISKKKSVFFELNSILP